MTERPRPEDESPAALPSARQVPLESKLQRAQDERRAALNLMEDAVQSRRAIEKLNAELSENEEWLAKELTASRTLHSVSALPIEGGQTQVLYQKIVDAAFAIMNSDCASLQMLCSERADGQGELLLLAHHGFEDECAKTFTRVRTDSGCTCGEALRTGERVIAADVESAPYIVGRPGLDAYRQSGIRAVQSTPLFSRGGQLLGMISTHWFISYAPKESDLRQFDILARQAADLMERKAAGDALRESEERFRTMVSVITDVTWTADPEGRFIVPQVAWESYTGQTWEQQCAFGWFNAFYPEDRERVKQMWSDACASRALGQSEGRLWHAVTQSWRYVMAKVVPLLNQDGSVREWVGTCIDCDDQKRAEENLEKMVSERTTELRLTINERELLQAQLLQVQKMESIGTLASGVAHDFNNLLNIILGYATSMRMDSKNPATIAEGVDVIEQTVKRGTTLVRQLLVLGRKGEAEFTNLTLNSLIEKFAALLAETFSKTIVVALDLESELPAIKGDENQFRQILLNLCLNSRDAMAEGGRISISTRAVSPEDLPPHITEVQAKRYVSITVSDTGSGMDDATLERIFEPFFTTKPLDKGTGLGLAVVYGIVKNHGGFITVTTQIGCGTTFCIYLPVSDAAAGLISETGPIAATPKCEGRGETILVVDDEAPQLNLMTRLLKRQGYKVLGAKDGVEAVDVFQRHQDAIAVAVMDLGLPKLDGWQAFKKMREIRPTLKALIATGFVPVEVEAEIANGDLCEIIAKPYQFAEVLEKISQAIQRSRMGQPSATS